MPFGFEELYMLRNNLKSYGQQIQSMFKTNKQNKQSKTKSKPKTTQTKTNERNTCELKSLNTK